MRNKWCSLYQAYYKLILHICTLLHLYCWVIKSAPISKLMLSADALQIHISLLVNLCDTLHAVAAVVNQVSKWLLVVKLVNQFQSQLLALKLAGGFSVGQVVDKL